MEAGDCELRITLRDDGRGDVDLARGIALLGLADRIETLGGHITLHSPSGAGTTLTMTLPLDRPSRPGEVPPWTPGIDGANNLSADR